MRNIVTYGLTNIGLYFALMAVLLVGEYAQKKSDVHNQENVVIRYGK